MNFLQPWIVWTLPLIALPVLIHLIHKRRHRIVEWGAMMFLLDGAKLSRGRQRLREILLLIMRTLAILGLLFGIGRPIAGGWVAELGGEEIDTIVLIVDRSASMAEEISGAPVSKLVSSLAGVRGALEIAGAAELVVIDAVRPSETVRTDGASGLDDLDLGRPTAAASDMPAAFETAVTYLEESAAGRSEIWVISDGQGADWQPDDGRWSVLEGALTSLPAGVRVRLSVSPERNGENLGVRVERARRVAGPEGSNTAELVLDIVVTRTSAAEGSGDTAQIVPLAIDIGGARSSVEVELLGREGRLQGYRIPIDGEEESGFGFVELTTDAQPADDRFWFVYGEAPTLETLVVSERKDLARVAGIAAELPLTSSLVLAARTVPPESIDEDFSLAGTSLVVWQAPLPAEGPTREAVDGFVGEGGVVLFLPPGDPTNRSYRGVRWTNWSEAPIGASAVSPETWRADDDLLRTGEDGTPLPAGETEIYRWCGVELDPGEGEDAFAHQTLASLPGPEALLVRASSPKGGVYFLGTWPTVEASNLASQGIVFVALVQRAIALAARSQQGLSQRDAGTSLDESWRQASELADGASLFERDVNAGVLTDGERFLALNRPESEDVSAIQPISAIEGLFGDLDVVVEEARGAAREESGLLEEIWRVFMILALVGLLAEALLCASEGDAPPVARTTP